MRTTQVERDALAEARIPKLGKWAQDFIRGLQGQLRIAERELAEIKQGPADSNVFRVWGLRSDDQAIGRDAHLRFNLGGGEHENVDVRLDHRGGRTTLYIAGDRSIFIEPAAGNAIHIRLIER